MTVTVLKVTHNNTALTVPRSTTLLLMVTHSTSVSTFIRSTTFVSVAHYNSLVTVTRSITVVKVTHSALVCAFTQAKLCVMSLYVFVYFMCYHSNSECETSSVFGHMTPCTVNFRMNFLRPISLKIKTAFSLKTLLFTDQTTRPLIPEDPYFIRSLLFKCV